MNGSLPGTARQRAIVRAILEAYAGDESILTIGVFGSLARPDDDEYSDIKALYRSRCAWLSNGRLAVTPEQETVFDHVVAELTS